MTPEDLGPAFQLMLEEARRSIDRQSERVQHFRDRAGSLVGFAAVLAAALGLDRGSRFGTAGAIAIGAFVLVAAAACFTLYPREFQFELSAVRMTEWITDPTTVGIDQMVYTTAIRHDQHHAYNYRKLRQMQIAISLGVVALSIETIALVVRLVL